MHFQLHLRTRRCVRFWISSHPALKFPSRSEFPRIWGCNRIFRGWGTCRNRARKVHSCRSWFCHNLFFFLQFLHPFRHRFGAGYQAGILSAASRAGMADVEQMKKIVGLFHSARVKLPLVKMSASWCLVSMYLIWIFGFKLILSNNQSKATLRVLATCIIVGLRPFIIILITASLSSKTYNIALEPDCVPFDGTWSILARSVLMCV